MAVKEEEEEKAVPTENGNRAHAYPILNASRRPNENDEDGGDDDDSILRRFEAFWSRSVPVVTVRVHERLKHGELWRPESFSTDFGHMLVDLVNCRTHRVIQGVLLDEFWRGFADESQRLCDLNARPMILKLKDWPTSDDFKQLMPERFDDLMSNMPLHSYINRSGALNLASYLPDFFCLPDLGTYIHTRTHNVFLLLKYDA